MFKKNSFPVKHDIGKAGFVMKISFEIVDKMPPLIKKVSDKIKMSVGSLNLKSFWALISWFWLISVSFYFRIIITNMSHHITSKFISIVIQWNLPMSLYIVIRYYMYTGTMTYVGNNSCYELKKDTPYFTLR